MIWLTGSFRLCAPYILNETDDYIAAGARWQTILCDLIYPIESKRHDGLRSNDMDLCSADCISRAVHALYIYIGRIRRRQHKKKGNLFKYRPLFLAFSLSMCSFSIPTFCSCCSLSSGVNRQSEDKSDIIVRYDIVCVRMLVLLYVFLW